MVKMTGPVITDFQGQEIPSSQVFYIHTERMEGADRYADITFERDKFEKYLRNFVNWNMYNEWVLDKIIRYYR